MAKKDPRVDAYIAKSADFAKPILTHIRKLVHAACPDVEETVKWGMPFFDHKGPIAHMAAFKAHCALGFWKGSLFLDKTAENSATGMGQFGRLTSLKDLPKEKTLAGHFKTAARLNDEDVKKGPPGGKAKPKPKLKVPAYFSAALKKDKKAAAGFASLSTAQQNEYVAWLEEAKTEGTRDKRLATALEWISEGKIRNWKYLKKS